MSDIDSGKNFKMISIIVPIYNAEKTLRRCLDSILLQNYNDIEIIAVDDGSTDNSLKICQKYASQDDRFKILMHKNQGVAVARNNGLKFASGDWITFIDSDDYIEPGYLSIGNDSDIDIYMQNWTVFGGAFIKPEHLDAGIYKEHNINDFLADHMQMDVFRMVCCKFYKKSIIDEHNIKFQTQYRVGEDTLFMLEYMKYTKSIKVLDTGEYKYFRPVNWGGKYSIKVNDAIDFFNAFINRYKEQPYNCWRLLDFMVYWYPYIIEDFYENRYVWYSSNSVNYAQNRIIFHKGVKNAISILRLKLNVLLHA